MDGVASGRANRVLYPKYLTEDILTQICTILATILATMLRRNLRVLSFDDHGELPDYRSR